MFRRAAHYIDRKIAKGAKAGDLPIERVTKFEIDRSSLKTAKALGSLWSFLPSCRADRVIE